MMAQMKTARVRPFFCKASLHNYINDLTSGVFAHADYCGMSGIEGFNCISEKLCVPQEHVCDGYPDCVIGTTVFDEMNCIPKSGTCRAAKTFTQCKIKGLAVAI